MKLLGSIGSFLWTLVLILLSFICIGNSFKQELWFYDAQGNQLYFQSHVSDTSAFSLYLPQVTRACARGVWDIFSAVNYEEYQSYYLGSYSSSDVICTTFTRAASVKSLRYEGANDTDTDALSLYDGWSAVSGNEIFVTAPVHTGITNQIFGIAITGASDWMLFEGQSLDGKSACFKVPSGYHVYYNPVGDLKLTTIGSVFKGCNLQEIQYYKMLQKPKLHALMSGYIP